MTRNITVALGLLILSFVSATNEARAASCPGELIAAASPLGDRPTIKMAFFAQGNQFNLCDQSSYLSGVVYDLSVSLSKDGTFAVNYDFYNGSATHGGSQKLVLLGIDEKNNTLLQISDEETPRLQCVYGHRKHVSNAGNFNAAFFDFITTVKVSIPRASGGPYGPC